MINLYCRLINTSLVKFQVLIEELFPENKSSVIKSGAVFLSDGDFFECSAEKPSHGKVLSLSATFKTKDVKLFKEKLNEFQGILERNNVIYDIEYEIERNEGFNSRFIRHPDFEKHIKSPSDLA